MNNASIYNIAKQEILMKPKDLVSFYNMRQEKKIILVFHIGMINIKSSEQNLYYSSKDCHFGGRHHES